MKRYGKAALAAAIGTVLSVNMMTAASGTFGSGDLNGDGVVTESDASLLSAWLTQKGDLTAEQAAEADWNGDGLLNGYDLSGMKRSILTLERNVTEQIFHADSQSVKPIGRTYYNETDETLWMAFSGTGAGFSMIGTKAEIAIAKDSNTASNAYARFAIYVNGALVVDDLLSEAEQRYTVYESDAAEYVEIRVVKLSETANSLCGISEIAVEAAGGLTPLAPKGRTIEFIGDSITCGYGVDAASQSEHFKTETEDFSKTYAYLAADLLDADYSAVSMSGYGVISGYTSGALNSSQTLPQYYDRFGYSWNTFGSESLSASDLMWDFETLVPDVIVVNLGTNDSSYTGSDADKCNEFAVGYTEFLKQIRAKNPDALIVCTLGIMGDGLYPYIEQAAAAYTEETGDENIACMKFDVQNGSDGYGADWHPSAVTHQKAAQKLAEELSALTGWTLTQE